jgi:hypothetical protein
VCFHYIGNFSHGAGTTITPSDICIPFVHLRFLQYDICDGTGLDVTASECLNTDDSVVALLKSETPLASNADAQLLFNIKLNGEARIQCLSIFGPADGLFCFLKVSFSDCTFLLCEVL